MDHPAFIILVFFIAAMFGSVMGNAMSDDRAIRAMQCIVSYDTDTSSMDRIETCSTILHITRHNRND